MAKLSVVISAFNEEKKIKTCLDSVRFADEIIFVDNSSTDNTAAIAKTYTKKVYIQKNDPEKIDLQKNFGIEHATGDWILLLDGDEQVPPELQQEIKQTIKDPGNYNGFSLPRKNIIFNKWIQHTGWYPDLQVRLFRRESGKYEKHHYHEPIHITGAVGQLQQNLLHQNYESVKQFLQKNLLVYAPNEADAKIASGYTFSYADAIRFPAKEFISRYFAREGYKDGFHGLVLSLLMGVYHLIIFAYLWEKQKFIDEPQRAITEVESGFSQTKKELAFWLTKQKIEKEKNTVKKIGLKVKNKFHL